MAAISTVVFSATLAVLSGRFGYDVDVIDMPCLTLVGLLVGAGAAYSSGLPRLVVASGSSGSQHRFLAIALTAGLVARLIMFGSAPILEDDYNRYLWDGAVTAHGYSPYAVPPLAVIEGRVQGPLQDLAADAGAALGRINHKSLTTIYPPVAQGAFALAHLIGPWSLAAWRGVLLAFDVATLGLLVLMLDVTDRSRLWCTLYWLNPVVLKEVFNSTHMEAVILPFVLLALLLAMRRRPLAASTALGLAAGAKFWPALLLPLMLRGAWPRERTRSAAAALVFAGLFTLWLAPMVIHGVDEANGLVAYADGWQINSALFPVIVGLLSSFRDWIGFSAVDANGLARMLIAILLAVLALFLAHRRLNGLDDLIARASVAVSALVLLSPALYPWYTVWMAPFLVFRPYRAFLMLTALIPLYYSFFHFAARGTLEIFNSYVVPGIWAPVWIVLFWGMAGAAFSYRECARSQQ
ncbi:glycosyltransferase 87 family protein [Hyphomicrobium sp. NDB2Meth4]|uniref:glycosyltransferase 87 family protein n=1 Tax=Hyphomicrobium sp. NDB2Meth4 TaxID=1892846 RepID=UPI0009303570|nr:glycosyltransferase 87 family protein [Hyphomicrobium sp. NDB2Meth4]